MRARGRLLTTICAVLASPFVAAADEDVAKLRLAAGVFEFNLGGARAGEFSGQYQGGRKTGPLHPVGGAMATTDGTLHVFAGFGTEVPLSEKLILRPTFCPGLYNRGHGKDLGAVFEFRSAVEIAWRLARGRRVGLELTHVSNSGYGRSNRGAESLLVTFTQPLPRR